MCANTFSISLTLALLVAVAEVKGQFWDLGTVNLTGDCSKDGVDIIPGLIDPWIFNFHCLTYNGTAACVNGICACNQGEDAYFSEGLQLCLGKVGAVCTAAHDSFFPDKLCTPNADCVPVQGEGYSVGKCECLYGFTPDSDGMCIEDILVDPEDRSTPRTTTTTEAPVKENVTIPWGLLINVNYVNYKEECWQPQVKFNQTLCHNYGRTVSCQQQGLYQNSCQCNMGDEDAIFDEELNMCVGRVGSYCLARQFMLGRSWKACTIGADCVLEDEHQLEDGYSFGTCECVYGFKETETRTCERDETVPNPSTFRTTTTTTPTPSTPSPTPSTPSPTPSTPSPTPSTPSPTPSTPTSTSSTTTAFSTASTTTTTSETPSDGCPPAEFDKIEHPSNCSLYFICAYGTAYEQQCGEGLHFNPLLKECDFPENANCTKELPDCPPEGTAMFPYPYGVHCSLYVVCVEGIPYIQECAAGTCFNPDVLKCSIETTTSSTESTSLSDSSSSETTTSDQSTNQTPTDTTTPSGGTYIFPVNFGVFAMILSLFYIL